MSDYQQTGYLNTDFRMFHLTDTRLKPIAFHYHDFHKILIVLKGSVSYCVEGRTYELLPGDIVFVPAGDVHRPFLRDESTYERIIIYISRDYLANYCNDAYDLELCLKEAHQKRSHVLRVPTFATSRLAQIARELEHALESDGYANGLYQNLLFLEFMIHLNRALLRDGIEYLTNSASNQKMLSVIDYLNTHITEDISIDCLADTFYLSRYHLMHTFKEETGYTIGNYITAKRLLLARQLLDQGHPITTVCYECGFHNYSTFSRAYHKHYGCSPREHLTFTAPSSY